MPEGHTLRKLADDLTAAFAGRAVRVSSPQGRFAAEAAQLDGATVLGADSAGKHLFVELDHAHFVHVHLGLIGSFDVHTDVDEVPEPADDRVALLQPDQVALGGPAEVGVRQVVAVGLERGHAEPDGPDRRRHGRRAGVHVERADQAEVDVDEPLAGELHEEVLSGRVGPQQGEPVELLGVGGEAALGAAHAHRSARERSGEVGGEAPEGVALRHPGRCRRAGPTRAAAAARGWSRRSRAGRSGADGAPRR